MNTKQIGDDMESSPAPGDVFQPPTGASLHHSGGFLGLDTQSRDSIMQYTPNFPYILITPNFHYIMGQSVFVFSFCFRDSIYFVVSSRSRDARAGEFVASEVLVCVDIY